MRDMWYTICEIKLRESGHSAKWFGAKRRYTVIMRENYKRLPDVALDLGISVRRLQQILKDYDEQLPGWNKIIRSGNKGTWLPPESVAFLTSVMNHEKMINLQIHNALLCGENEKLKQRVAELEDRVKNLQSNEIDELSLVATFVQILLKERQKPDDRSDSSMNCMAKETIESLLEEYHVKKRPN